MTVKERAWVKMFREDGWRENGKRCQYCAEPVTLSEVTADHVEPRKRGGTTKRNNIKPACRPCNRLKGSMGVSEFRNLIRNPPKGASDDLLLAHMRFRIWRRTWLACRRIMKSVAMPLPLEVRHD